MKMSKILAVAAFGFLSMGQCLAADEISVKITSFSSIDLDHHLAEICGKVSFNSEILPKVGNYIAVTVTADPKYNPGLYTVLASVDGIFCTTLISYSGTASAMAWFPTAGIKATTDIVNLGQHR